MIQRDSVWACGRLGVREKGAALLPYARTPVPSHFHFIAAFTVVLLAVAGCGSDPARGVLEGPGDPSVAVPFSPRTYVVQRAAEAPQVDGQLTEAAWREASWTEPFVDIQGAAQPAPRFRTRAKMLWDSTHFYVAAQLEEPDVWATLTERESIIYYDNNFEVFIDPDGDTHAYYELEVNALGTVWDLMLLKPYRDGGPALDAWDIRGLQVGVDIQGTLNDPRDTDEGWTVEIAMPWFILEEAAPGGNPPEAGDQWRLNFSRVEWQTVAENSTYRKVTDPNTGEPLDEDNWVWSPQGAINMHMPERWGLIQFAEAPANEAAPTFRPDPNQPLRWALRRLYYRQRRFADEHGHYADRLSLLRADDLVADSIAFAPHLHATASLYEIVAPGADSTVLHIQQDGRAWTTN